VGAGGDESRRSVRIPARIINYPQRYILYCAHAACVVVAPHAAYCILCTDCGRMITHDACVINPSDAARVIKCSHGTAGAGQSSACQALPNAGPGQEASDAKLPKGLLAQTRQPDGPPKTRMAWFSHVLGRFRQTQNLPNGLRAPGR